MPSCAQVKEPVLEEEGWITLLVEMDTQQEGQ
jgi:hypothetical protein